MGPRLAGLARRAAHGSGELIMTEPGAFSSYQSNLQRGELLRQQRRWALLTGAIISIRLVPLALTGLSDLLTVIGTYLSLFALCVCIPQWSDAFRAWRGKRLLAAEISS